MASELFKYSVAMMLKDWSVAQLQKLKIEHLKSIDDQKAIIEVIEAELKERESKYEVARIKEPI